MVQICLILKKIRELILKKNAGFLVQNHKDLTKMVTLIKTNKKIKNNTIKNFKNLCNSESKKNEFDLKKRIMRFLYKTPNHWKQKIC